MFPKYQWLPVPLRRSEGAKFEVYRMTIMYLFSKRVALEIIKVNKKNYLLVNWVKLCVNFFTVRFAP